MGDMREEMTNALLSGENLAIGDLSGVPAVEGEELVKQLQPEEAETEELEELPEEEAVEKPNTFLDAMGAVDIEADEAYSLQVGMQDADGNKVFKTVGELKDEFEQAHQITAERETTQNELATQKAELEAQQEAFRTTQASLLEMPQQLAEAESRIVAMEQYLKQNEQDLSAANPGQLALAKQELLALQLTRNNLQQMQYNQREALQQSLRQEQMIQQNRNLQKATEEMLRIIPAWADSEVRNKESQALIDYGISVGFSQTEMTTMTEPRHVKYLREQMLKDQALAGVKAKDDAPKPLQPQAVKVKQTAERVAYNKLIKKATESPDQRDKVEGIVALLSQ